MNSEENKKKLWRTESLVLPPLGSADILRNGIPSILQNRITCYSSSRQRRYSSERNPVNSSGRVGRFPKCFFHAKISPSSPLLGFPFEFDWRRENIYIEMIDTSFVTDPMKIRKIQQTAIKVGRIYNKMCADIALDYYNSINDTNFELVEDDETMGSYSFNRIVPGTSTYCFFKAKENCCTNDFFAEISHIGPLYPSVVKCNIFTQEE
ncbi:hypothetical protein P8452_09947 [Trifolium repens]|nr:hypothetical protein P8452_09947 [Trifolium repens]